MFMAGLVALLTTVLVLPSGTYASQSTRAVPLAKERDEVGKVRIAFSESSTAVVLVAIEKGFLAAEGIEAEAKPLSSGYL